LSNKRLIKSTSVISFATLVSRVLGFTRDIIIANLFGTTLFAQAFVVSFRIPNILRDLIGEGAANAAFVPVLTEYHAKRTENQFWHLANNLLFILILILFAISVLGVFFAPIIVRLIAPGFMGDPGKLALTISLTRIMFPFIFLIGITAYGMGVLNSLNHFAAPAFAPALLNVGVLFFLIFLCPKIGVKGLAFGVLVGGVLQVLLIAIALRRYGFYFVSYQKGALKEKIGFGHPAVKRIWRLLIPRFFGSAVYQLSVIVDNIFSTFEWIVGIGAPAALWYAYRLFHLPLAIFGIALSTAALPRMSREVAKGDIPALKETISFSLRSVFLVLIPAGIGLATLGRPIIQILFQRGEFTLYSTYITQSVLFYYSFGLFACGGIKILVNAFFSLGDTKTPVKIAAISLFVNLVLNAILMWPLKVGGLALATSIAASCNFLMLYTALKRKIGDVGIEKIIQSLLRVIAAAFIMGVFSFYSAHMLAGLDAPFFIRAAITLLVILASVGIYLVAGLFLGIKEMRGIIKWIYKKD